jgi:hypothetical protein
MTNARGGTFGSYEAMVKVNANIVLKHPVALIYSSFTHYTSVHIATRLFISLSFQHMFRPYTAIIRPIYPERKQRYYQAGRTQSNGAYMITAQIRLGTTYTQHPRRCKTYPNTIITGQRTTGPKQNIEVLIRLYLIFNYF